MWCFYAVLSALFAALTAIFGKIGVEKINSNLATAVRTVVILFLVWAIAFATTPLGEIKNISKHGLLFLTLSGLATGASWLCYYKALQMGEASKVAPVDKLSVVFTMLLAFLFLGETVSAKVLIGGLLILCGSLVIIL